MDKYSGWAEGDIIYVQEKEISKVTTQFKDAVKILKQISEHESVCCRETYGFCEKCGELITNTNAFLTKIKNNLGDVSMKKWLEETKL